MKRLLVLALLQVLAVPVFGQTQTEITTTATSTSSSTNTNNNNNTNNTTYTGASTNTNTNNSTINTTTDSTSLNTNVNSMNYNGLIENINTSTSTSTSNNTNTNINNTISTSNATNVNTNNTTSNTTSNSTSFTTSNSVSDITAMNTNNNVSNSQSVSDSTQRVTQKLESPPPSAIAPSIGSSYSQDLCTTGISGAVQTQILGLSTGRSVRDQNCERIKLGKTLYDMGMRVAAVSLMCQDYRVWSSMMSAGTPCPYEGKIGDEAKALWEANPDKIPEPDRRLR